MRALRNMKVRYKIMLPLLTLAAIILFMGMTNYSGMNDIMNASTSISGNYARCLDMVGDFNADFQHMARIAYNHIVADDKDTYREFENDLDEVHANVQSTREQFEQLLDIGTSEEVLYEQFLQAFDSFDADMTKLMQLSSSGSNRRQTGL